MHNFTKEGLDISGQSSEFIVGINSYCQVLGNKMRWYWQVLAG